MQERMSKLASILAVAGVSSLVAACAATNTPQSLEGIKEVFHDPGFAVQGKTRKDQKWISETQETGIRVLGWKRPVKAKIASAKRIKAKQKITPQPPPSKPLQTVPLPPEPPVGQPTEPLPLQPAKKHWWQR